MNYLIENWYIIVGLICVGVVLGMTIYHFVLLPNDKKMALFKETLASLVKEAEELIGSGKGQEKLEWVYNTISKKFPLVTMFMSNEEFTSLVNDALIRVGIWLKK